MSSPRPSGLAILQSLLEKAVLAETSLPPPVLPTVPHPFASHLILLCVPSLRVQPVLVSGPPRGCQGPLSKQQLCPGHSLSLPDCPTAFRLKYKFFRAEHRPEDSAADPPPQPASALCPFLICHVSCSPARPWKSTVPQKHTVGGRQEAVLSTRIFLILLLRVQGQLGPDSETLSH